METYGRLDGLCATPEIDGARCHTSITYDDYDKAATTGAMRCAREMRIRWIAIEPST